MLFTKLFNSSIALVSANFGGIDKIKQLPESNKIDSFYFTDKNLGSSDYLGWKHIKVCNYFRPCFDFRFKARYFKHQITNIEEVSNYNYLVWSDSSLRFKDLSIINETVAKLKRLPKKKRMAVIPHPERKNILEEYYFIKDKINEGNKYLIIRYKNENMDIQIEHYKSKGFDLSSPLWCGTFWIVENNCYIKKALNDWWNENIKWGLMDQLSFSCVMHKHKIKPINIDINLWDNKYFEFVKHQKSQ